MTITGGSALPKDDIDRMVKEAEEHAAEDKKRREEAETRNQAEAFVYSTEKLVNDNKDKIPADVASEVESDIADVKKALEGDDADAVKAAHEKLGASSQKIGQALYAAAEQEQAAGDQSQADADATAAAGAGSAPDEDVVDAEIVDEDETK